VLRPFSLLLYQLIIGLKGDLTVTEKESLIALNHLNGKNIRATRMLKDLTLEELAFLANIDRAHLGDIERSSVNMTVGTLFKISAGLGLNSPLELLIEGKQEIYPRLLEAVKERSKNKE